MGMQGLLPSDLVVPYERGNPVASPLRQVAQRPLSKEPFARDPPAPQPAAEGLH
jgi:hypothetical protein